MEFEELPEGCIAGILYRTTPVDACRFCVVSKTFRSAAESDVVWERFLPPDYRSIISQSALPLNTNPSKKALYLALSDRPVIIDQGQKSFQLEKKSGKKCYMLGARALAIIWGGTERYWTWTTDPDSRFPEVAALRNVCWLEILGVLNTLVLSPNTKYAAYLVFKMINPYGFDNLPVMLSVNISGGHGSTTGICLDPNPEEDVRWCRSDGWLEIEMGEFFNTGGSEDDELQMRVTEIEGGNWKRGLFIEGIEVRPTEDY